MARCSCPAIDRVAEVRKSLYRCRLNPTWHASLSSLDRCDRFSSPCARLTSSREDCLTRQSPARCRPSGRICCASRLTTTCERRMDPQGLAQWRRPCGASVRRSRGPGQAQSDRCPGRWRLRRRAVSGKVGQRAALKKPSYRQAASRPCRLRCERIVSDRKKFAGTVEIHR